MNNCKYNVNAMQIVAGYVTNSSFALGNFLKFFFLNIFNPRLVKSVGSELMHMESLLDSLSHKMKT